MFHVLFILVLLTYFCLQVYGLTCSCRSPLLACRSLDVSNKLYVGSWSLTHNLVCRGVFISVFFHFYFVFLAPPRGSLPFRPIYGRHPFLLCSNGEIPTTDLATIPGRSHRITGFYFCSLFLFSLV